MQWKTPEAFQRLLAAMVAAQDMKVRTTARSFILCCAQFKLTLRNPPRQTPCHILVLVLCPTLTLCFHLVLITFSCFPPRAGKLTSTESPSITFVHTATQDTYLALLRYQPSANLANNSLQLDYRKIATYYGEGASPPHLPAFPSTPRANPSSLQVPI